MTTTPTVWKSISQLNPTGTGSQADAAIIDIGLGRYVAVWTEAAGGPIAIDGIYAGSDLVGQIFDAEGNTVGNEFRVNVSRYADDEQDVALAPRLGGGFAAVYEDTDANGTSIVIDFFDVNGAHLSGNDIQVDLGSHTLANPSVAMNTDGSYLITYERSNNTGVTTIVGKTLSADLLTLSAEFAIFGSTDVADDSTNPEVVALSNGNFVVVYEDEYQASSSDIDVKMTFVSAGGSVSLSDTVAGTSALEDDPHVAALAGGGFVVVWRTTDIDGTGIQATVYDNAGDEVNNFIHVNTTTAGNQSDPEVAALADGGFVVVWNDPGSGVIRGQRFDAGGNEVGSEFTQNFSVEDNPVVAALSDGRFIVGFEDVDNAPTDIDLHATIFDPRTSPISGDNNDNVITSRKDGATVKGLGGSDTLLGQESEDILDGGTGADWMYGGSGDDIYVVDNTGDQAIENFAEGTDTVFSTVSHALGGNIENLVLGDGAITGVGNGLGNSLYGNDANNVFDGLGGVDFMAGGLGDDLYFVDNGGDFILENAGEGNDTVGSTVSYGLGANVENLGLTGTAGIDGAGNELANVIVGNDGNNTLYGLGGDDQLSGGLGADAMIGGAGNDLYLVDNAGDSILENAGEGSDTVASSVTFALGNNIENLVLIGSGNIAGTGNNLGNALVGNAGKNTLNGGKGGDILSGGLGKDKLLGKGGKDTFVFRDAIDAANADKIKDFKHKKETIFLDQALFGALGPKVSKNEISYGKKAGDKNDHLIVSKGKIYYDADGKGGAKQVLFAKVGKKVDIDHKDFAIGDSDLLVV